MEEKRLDRIEAKLDNLSEAISKLAVVDERLANVISENSRTAQRVEHLEQLPQRVLIIERFNSNVSKLLWIIVVAVVALISKMLFGV